MPTLYVIFAACFGGAASAFLPRVAYRLAVKPGELPRSGCAVCSRPFPQGPIGWVRAGPPCPCTSRLPLTVPAGASVCALLAAGVGPDPMLPEYLLAAVPGVLLAVVDLRCLRLPDPVVAAFALVLVLPSAVAHPGRLGGAVVGGGVVFGAYLLIAVLTGGRIGLGDVKLAGVLGLTLGFAGWPAILAGLAAAHLLNGLVAGYLLISGKARRGTGIPFGPALLAGALLVLVVG